MRKDTLPALALIACILGAANHLSGQVGQAFQIGRTGQNFPSIQSPEVPAYSTRQSVNFPVYPVAQPVGIQVNSFLQSTSEPVYAIRPSVDLPVFFAAAAWDIYNFSQIAKKDGSSLQSVNSLKISDINWFDRWAVHPYSKSIDQLSYIPFYVAIPLPLIVFGIDERMRKDFLPLTFLYAQAMTLTGVLYSSAVHYVDRFRPLVYESSSPIDTRLSPNSRNSFFAGHVALVSTSVFFIARTYADYHPRSKAKWIFYTGAALITGLTGYWRNMAGEHFPTDIALGSLVGISSGLLTPALHRIKKKAPVTVLP
ncbi:MAG TPA: phosphatase PAP2 family protein [Puia sp.]|nr:phosphatase PAP2 family protein [Puia sp.]